MSSPARVALRLRHAGCVRACRPLALASRTREFPDGLLFVKLRFVEPAHSWAEHTGELELVVEADTEAGLFVAAANALAELLAGDEAAVAQARPPDVEVEVSVGAADRPALLAEWLAELAFLAETEGLIPERVGDLRLSADGIEAKIAGRRGAPPHLVKAVTYHRLEMGRADGGWRGRAVLDV